MKRNLSRKNSAGRKVCFLLILCVGLGLSSLISPSLLTAAGSPYPAKNTKSVLQLVTAPASSTLEDFVKVNIDKLAAEAPFKSWKNAQSKYYPLGPGTHSWLVNVMNGDQRIGYMIITATTEGGYVLSEYGAGNEGLPYSLSELRQLLVQEGLIPSTYSGKLALKPLYLPLLPLWEVTLSGKKFYINAAVPEILPWSYTKVETLSIKASTVANLYSFSKNTRIPQPIFLSHQSSDPYENILWIKNPKLPIFGEDEFSTLLQQKGSLVFQSAGHNDSVGGPLMITGYQIWRTVDDPSESVQKNNNLLYAAIGPEGKRFVPLPLLQKYGTLHEDSAEQ